jgi:glycosyltransferase involved in cell wall biosynthesis
MSAAAKKAPECSVVIPTYNRVTLLKYTLEALAKQRLPREDFEVLVVDDGSSDGTADMVASYHDRLNLRYFFQPDEGWRSAKARNVGIEHAAGDICVFVDSGVLLHSRCLEAHIASHRSASVPLAVCGYVYGYNINNEDADLIIQAIDPDDPDGTIARMQQEQKWLDFREFFYAKYTDEFHGLAAPWTIYWTSNVSASTEQVRSVGAFDEAFQTWGGEDMDLAYRLYRDGAKFIVNRQASSIHFPHYKSFEENEQQAKQNYVHMVKKYDTPIIRLLLETPDVHPFNIHEVIEERGLPRCQDYVAARRLAS